MVAGKFLLIDLATHFFGLKCPAYKSLTFHTFEEIAKIEYLMHKLQFMLVVYCLFPVAGLVWFQLNIVGTVYYNTVIGEIRGIRSKIQVDPSKATKATGFFLLNIMKIHHLLFKYLKE